MKKITFLINIFLISCFVSFANASENRYSKLEFYPDTAKQLPQRKIDKMPEFPGGEQAMIEFIAKHLKYPKKARKNKIEGTVIVQFMIKNDGKVVAINIDKKVSDEIDNEAIRIINKMPNWKPAEYQGKAVTTFMNLPLNFVLEVK